ncbi:MAG TPA: hypothetical protein VGM56_03070 [Byssovorax sp.]
MRRAAAASVLAASLAFATRARAQLPTTSARTLGEQTPSGAALGISQKLPFWGAGATRFFVATTFELGVLNTRETVAIGYGKPHWQWIGVDGYTSVATQGGTNYAGVHVATPYVELRAGARYAFDIGQYFLVPRDQFTRYDVADEGQPVQRYLAYESELSIGVPLPSSALFGIATVTHFDGAPQGYWIFDDVLHTVFAPPWGIRGRVGYYLRTGIDENLKLGAAVELIDSPDRNSVTFRAGPVAALTLTHHTDLTASFMAVIAARDELGLLGGEFTTIGIRYRWASGDRWPEFP